MKKLKNIKKLVPIIKKIKVLNKTRQCLAWKRENIIKCKASDSGEMLNLKKMLLLPPKLNECKIMCYIFLFIFSCVCVVRGVVVQKLNTNHGSLL